MELFATNPIAAARIYGEETYRAPGRVFMPELEVNFLDLCLGRGGKPVYPHNGKPYKGRIRRHSLLLARADATKSTQALVFLDELCNARSINGAPPDHDGPIYGYLTSDTTWESYRGGVQDGAPVYPTLHLLDYIIAEEALAYLGSTPPTIENQANRLMDPLESGNVNFSQKQAAAMSKKNKAAFKDYCDEHGIDFEERSGSFHFKCKFNAIFCSRFFEPKVEEVMHKSGFKGRFASAIFDPNDDQLAEYVLKQYGQEPAEVRDILYRFNRMAWRATYDIKNLPTEQDITQIIAPLVSVYRSIAHTTGKSLEEVYPKRTYQNVVQLLMAHALSDSLASLGPLPESEPVHIERLHYTQDVKDAVLRWLLDIAMQEQLRIEQNENASPVLMDSVRALTDFLTQRKDDYEKERSAARKAMQKVLEEEPWRQDEFDDGRAEHFAPKPMEFFTRKELVTYLENRKVPSVPARIAKLERAGYIIRLNSADINAVGIEHDGTRASHYKAAPFLVNKLGYTPHDDLVAEFRGDEYVELDEDFSDLRV